MFGELRVDRVTISDGPDAEHIVGGDSTEELVVW